MSGAPQPMPARNPPMIWCIEDGALVGHAATDALGNKFLEVVFCILEVTVFRTLLHGFQ